MRVCGVDMAIVSKHRVDSTSWRRAFRWSKKLACEGKRKRLTLPRVCYVLCAGDKGKTGRGEVVKRVWVLAERFQVRALT